MKIILIIICIVSILFGLYGFFKPPKEKIVYEKVMVEGIPNSLEGFYREVTHIGNDNERIEGRLIIRQGKVVFEQKVNNEISP